MPNKLVPASEKAFGPIYIVIDCLISGTLWFWAKSFSKLFDGRDQQQPGARGWHFCAALALAAGLCGALAGAVGLAAVVVAVLLALALRAWMRKNFGGVTGDLLGCACVVVETVLLLGLAALMPLLPPAAFVFAGAFVH